MWSKSFNFMLYCHCLDSIRSTPRKKSVSQLFTVQLFRWSLFKYIHPHFYYIDQRALKQDWQKNHRIFYMEMKVKQSLNLKEDKSVTSVWKCHQDFFPPSIATILQRSSKWWQVKWLKFSFVWKFIILYVHKKSQRNPMKRITKGLKEDRKTFFFSFFGGGEFYIKVKFHFSFWVETSLTIIWSC